ncbi:MAG: hypothetical protein WCD49_09715 [Candidatus Acidiferrales bacterium]
MKSREDGRKFLAILVRHFPNHIPEQFGESEPLQGRFDAEMVDAALKTWGQYEFIAQRQEPILQLQVHFTVPSPVPKHSTISLLQFQARSHIDVKSMETFVCEVSTVFGADFAVAHILTKSELTERLEILKTKPGGNVEYMKARVQKEGFAKVLWGMTVLKNHSLQVRNCLPDLSWLTVFGRPYVDMFGREKILTAPASQIAELSNGAVAVKVTDHLDDNLESWEEFKMIRERCEKHLDHRAFCTPANPGQRYLAPKFEFPLDMYSVDAASSRQ